MKEEEAAKQSAI